MVWSWFSSGEGVVNDQPETSRGGYECAPYSILETLDDYQVRLYPSRKWATVLFEKQENDKNNDSPLSSNWKEQPQNKSFMKLFGYITGTNEDSSKISMTVPVSTRVSQAESDQGHIVTQEEMGFYVPEQFQEETPQPKPDQEVAIKTRPEMVAYVRQFGGFAKEKDWKEQKEALRKSLENREDFGQIQTDEYFRQGFDAPYKFWNRKNEIFFIKKADEQQNAQ